MTEHKICRTCGINPCHESGARARKCWDCFAPASKTRYKFARTKEKHEDSLAQIHPSVTPIHHLQRAVGGKFVELANNILSGKTKLGVIGEASEAGRRQEPVRVEGKKK